jgi:broad specificity phosphatase PhoE
MEIVLARHGRPKIDQWTWMAPCRLADWLRAYDEADVSVDDVPQLVSARAVESRCIIASPLLRCAQSARALAPTRDISTEEIFREVGLPHALWGFPRLPLSVWTVIFRVAWFCGYSANAESFSTATNRARCAAGRLIDLAHEHKSVFVMGHAVMTALIAKQLVQAGWTGPKRPTHRYWQYCVYRLQ